MRQNTQVALTQQTFILSEFWRPEAQNQGLGGPCSLQRLWEESGPGPPRGLWCWLEILGGVWLVGSSLLSGFCGHTVSPLSVSPCDLEVILAPGTWLESYFEVHPGLQVESSAGPMLVVKLL